MVVNGNHDAVISTSNRLVNTRHINNIHSLNEILSVTMQINGESTALGKSDHASDTEPLSSASPEMSWMCGIQMLHASRYMHGR